MDSFTIFGALLDAAAAPFAPYTSVEQAPPSSAASSPLEESDAVDRENGSTNPSYTCVIA